MNKRKNIDQLFKAAKEETPKKTFEEVSQKFEHSLMPNTTIDTQTYLSNFNLLIVAVISMSLAVALFWGFPSSTESVIDSTSNPITQATNIIELQNPTYDTITSMPAPTPEKIVVSKLKQRTPEHTNTASSKTFEGYHTIKTDTQKNTTNDTITSMSAPTPEEIVVSKPKQRTPEHTNTASSKTFEGHRTIKTDTQKNITNTSAVMMLSENDSSKKRETPLIASSPTKDDFTIIKDTLSSSAIKANQAIKPSNTIASQTKVNKPKDVLITPYKASKTKRDLLLSKRDKDEVINSFVSVLEAYGIETNIVINKKVNLVIKKLTLQLAHSKGLEWQIKLQSFDYLEIRLLLNEKEELEGITYRLNQVGAFADFLTLKHKAKSVHKFSGILKHKHTKHLN